MTTSIENKDLPPHILRWLSKPHITSEDPEYKELVEIHKAKERRETRRVGIDMTWAVLIAVIAIALIITL